jgi:hypothetical protein
MSEFVPFCDNHIATQECDHDCMAHMNEHRILPCPYAIVEEAKEKCIDFQPFKQR